MRVDRFAIGGTAVQSQPFSGSFTRTSRRERGVVVIVFAVAAFTLMGMLGLGTDLARMYVAKNELQNFTDAASIAAATRLDGTVAGFTAATTAATGNTNKWGFGTQSAASITVDFAQALAGPYQSAPGLATGYRFVRVSANGGVPLYFMGMVPGVGFNRTVGARSVAGQGAVPGLGDGVIPFSPDSHDPTDPTGNYGFLLGRKYTLKYEKAVGSPAAGTYLTSIDGVKLIGCDADMAAIGSFQPGETSNSERGYIDLANLTPLDGGGGAALIRAAVLSKVSFQNQIVPFMYNVVPEPGQKQTILDALAERVTEDTDTTTPTYYSSPQTATGVPTQEVMNTSFRNGSTYHVDPTVPLGNGRRVVVTPVNDPDASGLVIGFGAFLLPPNPCAELTIGSKKYYPCCGEYIGPSTVPGGGSGASGGGVYRIMLFQ
jgi:Flp pilus assembly protein TadG